MAFKLQDCGSNVKRRSNRRANLAIWLTSALLIWAPSLSAAAEPVEKVMTYTITGETPLELYRSIGSSGPNGAIAQTQYKLTWQRLFDERGGDCYLVHARPKLTITYLYPKPASALTGEAKRRWDVFIAGVKRHEVQHGVMIREMTKDTQASFAGLMAKNDPTCRKIKAKVTSLINAAADTHKANSRRFDEAELGPGGPVHGLVRTFVGIK